MTVPALETTVEIAFGFGPNDTVADDSDWTDVTDFVDLQGLAPGMSASSGRSAVLGDLTPEFRSRFAEDGPVQLLAPWQTL